MRCAIGMIASMHVLDDDAGDAAIANAQHQLDRIAYLGRVQARHHLVQQQQLRLGRERARHLEPALLGRPSSLPAGRSTNARSDPTKRRAVSIASSRAVGDALVMEHGADHHVVAAPSCDANVRTIWNVRAMPRRARLLRRVPR